MPLDLVVPPLGESIAEVVVGEWLKREGDPVERDEPVVELESEKATVELPSPAAGTLVRILARKGTKVAVGDALGSIEPSAERPRTARPSQPPTPLEEAAARAAEKESVPPPPGEPVHVMPAAARALAQHGLSPAEVTPSGPGGRLLKEDVERHAAGARVATALAPPPAAGSDLADLPPAGDRTEEVVPMSPLRLRIAERLVAARREMAMLTTFNEIDMGEVARLRKELGEAFRERHGVRLGLMSFFVRATVEALAETPQLNAEIRGENVVLRKHVDMGIAVGSGKGLVVPVIRDAHRLGFADIEKIIADFGVRARDNRLTLDELRGGTFTISNGGVYGSLLSTPIVNPPQVGILGLHAVQDRPVGRDGQVVLRPMMYVALSYDHRLVDGREAVTFLRGIKLRVENPGRLLLGV
jgi:2-oxoglutarate dehydrogenase E2 component (dihydrolipoamide succinyltransferase)